MGIFDIFKKKTDVVEEDEKNIENPSSDNSYYVTDMFESIGNKCEYGDSIEKLSREERVFFVCQILEMEVNNGGFEQFFTNSSGDYSNEIVDALNEIGAFKTAEICQNAIDSFGGKIPENWEKRNKFIDIVYNEKIGEILNQCDNEFYKYQDDLTELCYAYITKRF